MFDTTEKVIAFPGRAVLPPQKIRKAIQASSIALLTLVLLFSAWPKLRTYAQALAILEQLNGKPVPRLLKAFAEMPLHGGNLALPSSAGTVHAHLYTPVAYPNAPGIVLVPGIHHLGIDEPRLVSFARSIAACGLRVMTPELPDSREYRIQPSDLEAIGTAAQWLSQATGRRVGLVGISFSGGLALMTAAQPAYAREVSFVFSIGAHDNLFRVASFYTNGADPLPNGDVERATPNAYGPLILEFEHLEDFVPAADIPAIRPVLRAHLHQNAATERRGLMTLSKAQKAEYARLINTANQDWAVSVSNKRHFAEMAAVSPHGHLEGLRAPVYILHGRGDNLIPFAEAEWLARDLPPGTLQEMAISPLIGHVGLVHENSGLRQKWQLLHLLAQVMERAENPPHG